MTRIKPTREECRIIRNCAERSAGYRKVEICPSTKCNLKYDRGAHFNILFVTDEPTNWNDTDLADNAYEWKDFTKGIELKDGAGIFDFYVYGPMGHWKELQTNVTAYYDGGKLVRVDGTCDGTMWKAA